MTNLSTMLRQNLTGEVKEKSMKLCRKLNKENKQIKAELFLVKQQHKKEQQSVSLGYQLSNVAFNLAQRENYALTKKDCESLDTLRKLWDKSRCT